MLMRFDPFRDADRLAEQLWGTAKDKQRVLPMDAYRRGEQFWVHFDLPGIDPSSVELTIEKNVLTVKAERPPQRGEADEMVVAERSYGTFTRQLFLGDTLDTGRIDASYHDGVLTLVIPIAESAKPRRVQINSSTGSDPRHIEAASH